ncbi:RPEL repeat protein [Lepidopterella palustris CBS 459.81]|uniref:RPEL repeat protein n=1 Tax=Lepidopterella palustris CBS 459.81 TaxID=1314670 RepID=A0A8E2E972_9PEZI|nr:RPEL repeat protein [Lepidopterella palustris CBS 459.81]
MADQALTIDETPISPVRQSGQRRNSLEKHLQHRPDAQDLKNRNILLDTNAAPTKRKELADWSSLHRSLQSTALELERHLASDNLKKGLAHRLDRDTLVERNILPDSTAAPALQGHQRELDLHMRANSLEKGLQSRPNPEDLVKKGILNEDEIPARGV